MGKILKQKLDQDSVVAEVKLSKDEIRDLEGEMEDVVLFTDRAAQTEARISLRGRNEATKYFLIPKTLRKDLNSMGSVSCQRIKRGDRDIFIYVVESDTDRKSYLPAEAA